MLCPGCYWLIRGHPLKGRGGCIPSSICLSDFDYRLHCSVGAVCRRIIWSSILLGEISSNPAAFLFLIFLRTESSSSWVNGPSLMYNCLLIILVIGSCVTFVEFPSRFSKCCFHSFILSCWFAAFSFALTVLFLLLTSFIVYQAILDCLSSTESLILSIWFWMYSVCSFIYMPANWYCAVFSFGAFLFVGFFDSFWRLFHECTLFSHR